ncbi:hypothetical protein EWM64_g5201 [Hericium alpestre]|uniref:EF-hand domain-containing protein n=1 Tax=Hericium alpestre TaxID=135208 RepID=A0A4Y9ZY10_9AGAM|nr:hypothetical protein EWM64_g5201 [Hericium alpestre]
MPRLALAGHIRPPARLSINTRSPALARALPIPFNRQPPHRLLSTSPPPRRPLKSVLRTAVRYTTIAVLSSAFGVTLLIGGIFLHDACTYTDLHIDRVPVSPLALHPEHGGPKNLPIAVELVGDLENEEAKKLKDKPRLVVIGGGWGAVGAIEQLHAGDYHVTVVSPDTFNTFTPLLPSAAVGTVSIRSLIEPLRKIIARLHGQFINARAIDIVMSERLVELEAHNADGSITRFYLPYDKLVLAVGSVSSTHGVPGLENCYQLKTVADAQAIRRRILDNFEMASLPTTDPKERKRLLSFVVCGGGPTGVETAAEIYDLCQEDIINYVGSVLSVCDLVTDYSEAISRYAEDKFRRDGVCLITSARFGSVPLKFHDRETGEVVTHDIPSNFVLWSTGIAMNPFTARVSSLLPNQVHKKAIEVDAQLRVKGAPLGEVYAIGDCATIETSVVAHLLDLVEEADRNKDGRIDYDEWEFMAHQGKDPDGRGPAPGGRALFDLYDSDADNSLTLNELAVLLQEIGNKITALPATAQVASQQGKYLGKKLQRLASQRSVLQANEVPDLDEAVSGPFHYLHLGSLAYIGNAAVFDLGRMSFMGGLVAMYAWRSVYWSEQVSLRTRALLMIDWIVRGVWGRDLSRL